MAAAAATAATATKNDDARVVVSRCRRNARARALSTFLAAVLRFCCGGGGGGCGDDARGVSEIFGSFPFLRAGGRARERKRDCRLPASPYQRRFLAKVAHVNASHHLMGDGLRDTRHFVVKVAFWWRARKRGVAFQTAIVFIVRVVIVEVGAAPRARSRAR